MKSLTIGADLEEAIERMVQFLVDLRAESSLSVADYRSAARIALRRYLAIEDRKADEDTDTAGGR
jgi:hypothetical protein